MGSARDERGLHQCCRRVLVWSLLLLSPLAAAYEDRFCADYVEDACSELSSEVFEAVGSICKCFVKGPDVCCNLDGEDGILAPDMLGAFKSVFVSNASSVTYTQLCGTPQKVTFDKVNNGIIVYEKKFAGMDCLMDFKAVDSTLDNIQHCRRVQLYTSSVTKIADSALLLNLVLDRSQVETIENFTMTQSASDPAECLAFDDSRVSNLRNIVAMCDVHIAKSKIKQISGTSLFRSRISSTEVEEVLTDGLTLQHGWHKLVNVTIQNLRKNALTFGSFSEVNLYNLEIIQCDMPCIISRTKYVNFKNLIINGNKIEDFLDTPYIDVNKYAARTLIGSNSTLCQQIGKSLECRSDRVSQYKVMEFLPDFSFPETKLSKFSFMGVSSHCFKVLKLEEVNGWVRSLRPEDPSIKDLCRYENRQIIIKDCERIDYIQSDYLDQLVADDSDIQFLDLSSRLSKVYLSNVKIHVLENMEYASRSGVKSSFNLKSVKISSLYNLLLKSPGLLTDFSVLGRVSNFTVDTPREAITTIRGGVMRMVPAQGITIRSGVLTLENVKILEMGYGAINIEDSGRLLIIPSADLLEPFICDKGPRIVVRRLSQVAFLYPMPTPSWLRQCTVSEGEYSDQEDAKLKFKNFVTEDDCNFDVEDHATCNMSNARGPTFLGGSNALKNVGGVTVSGSANLTVGDNCFDVIKLEGVISADFVDLKNSCYYVLILTTKTSVLNVVNNLYELRLYQSSIRKLAPSATLVSVEAINSTIRRLSATIKKGLFKNVTIKDISALKVTNEVEFINCNLTKFYKGSVEVERGAILRFTNCSINMMSAKSFNVRGSVLFTNVTINLAENETISIDRDAFVTMEGVSFRKEVVNLFAIDSSPHILLNDVKMNKDKVKLDKRFDVSVSYMNGTVVGQGHLESETEARMKKVWFCVTGQEIIICILFCAVVVGCYVAFKMYQKKRAEQLMAEPKQQAPAQQAQEEQPQEGQEEQPQEVQAARQPSAPMAQLAQEALQVMKGPHQQGPKEPEEVPLQDVGSAESVCTSTATTSTDDSGKSLGVEETVLITIDKGSHEDVGQSARGGEHGSGHESPVTTSASVQPRKGGPKKTTSKASDDPEGARDDEDPDDEQPLLKMKTFGK